MLAALKLRAVPINVNYRYMEEELRYLLDDCDAKAIVFDASFAPKLAAISSALPLLTSYLAVDDTSAPEPSDDADLDESLHAIGAVAYEDALAGASPVRDFGPRSSDDKYILYTGGTTGNPKGVIWRAEDIFFGGLGGGNLGEAPITRARGDHRAARPGPAHAAGVPPHARHRALVRARDPLHRWHGRPVARSPPRPASALGAHRARAGHVPRHRRGRVRAPVGGSARHARPVPRPVVADRRAVGRRDPLADGEGTLGGEAAGHDPHRRLRLVGVGRAGQQRHRRRRARSRPRRAFASTPRPRCSTTTSSRPRPV